MSRSKWKPIYINNEIIKKIKNQKKKIIKVFSRNSTITQDFVGTKFAVYNGQRFLNIIIQENMIGHKLGEFAPSRRKIVLKHKKKLKKKK